MNIRAVIIMVCCAVATIPVIMIGGILLILLDIFNLWLWN